jgi:hypothetical protein
MSRGSSIIRLPTPSLCTVVVVIGVVKGGYRRVLCLHAPAAVEAVHEEIGTSTCLHTRERDEREP